jgi:hypothetical protein
MSLVSIPQVAFEIALLTGVPAPEILNQEIPPSAETIAPAVQALGRDVSKSNSTFFYDPPNQVELETHTLELAQARTVTDLDEIEPVRISNESLEIDGSIDGENYFNVYAYAGNDGKIYLGFNHDPAGFSHNPDGQFIISVYIDDVLHRFSILISATPTGTREQLSSPIAFFELSALTTVESNMTPAEIEAYLRELLEEQNADDKAVQQTSHSDKDDRSNELAQSYQEVPTCRIQVTAESGEESTAVTPVTIMAENAEIDLGNGEGFSYDAFCEIPDGGSFVSGQIYNIEVVTGVELHSPVVNVQALAVDRVDDKGKVIGQFFLFPALIEAPEI